MRAALWRGVAEGSVGFAANVGFRQHEPRGSATVSCFKNRQSWEVAASGSSVRYDDFRVNA